uniref:Uncharacterized protein n=1 Tax=Anopheles farauti TaxID=69004 RepID=A0A182QGF4_9DIPT
MFHKQASRRELQKGWEETGRFDHNSNETSNPQMDSSVPFGLLLGLRSTARLADSAGPGVSVSGYSRYAQLGQVRESGQIVRLETERFPVAVGRFLRASEQVQNCSQFRFPPYLTVPSFGFEFAVVQPETRCGRHHQGVVFRSQLRCLHPILERFLCPALGGKKFSCKLGLENESEVD